MNNIIKNFLRVHLEAKKAIHSNTPIVGIDFSFVLNNFTYPDSLEVFKNISKIVRKHKAIPASIAIIDGVVKFGLTNDEVEMLAIKNDLPILNKNDLPFFVLNNRTGLVDLPCCIELFNSIGINIIVTGVVDNSLENVFHLNVENTILICSTSCGCSFLSNNYIKNNCYKNNFSIVNLTKDNPQFLSDINLVDDLYKVLKINNKIYPKRNTCIVNKNFYDYDNFSDTNLPIYANIKVASELSILYCSNGINKR